MIIRDICRQEKTRLKDEFCFFSISVTLWFKRIFRLLASIYAMGLPKKHPASITKMQGALIEE